MKLKDKKCKDFEYCNDCPFWNYDCPYWRTGKDNITMQEIKEEFQKQLDNIDLEVEVKNGK